MTVKTSVLSLMLLVAITAHADLQTTPTRQVWQSLQFSDDMDLANLELALDRQLENFARTPMTGRIRYGTKVYPRLALKESAEEMRRLARETRACLLTSTETTNKSSCWNAFSASLNDKFDIFVPVPGRDEPGHGNVNSTFFTAYFSPDLVGSRTQTERFKHPIYALPQDAVLRNLSREEIDFDGKLAGKGLELLWVEDSLFDLYILHVEGGGRVHITHEDGSEELRFLSFAGKNNRGGRFVSHYMRSRGYITPGNDSMEHQRQFLEENPQLHREIFSTYEAYIFFKETDTEPLGVGNIPLTEGRSLAIDTRIYSHVGVVTFVQAEKPVLTAEGLTRQLPFSRFFVTQDTGGAIRGNARSDLYMGFGRQAAHAASNMKTQGKQFFLIRK